MLPEHHQNSVCRYAETLLAYLYGEADAAEKNAFEAHLKICRTCGDELKSLGAARTAVDEWRAADFEPLPTPIFEIPQLPLQTAARVEKSASWFEELKRIFSFKPALAMSGLAILVALFGVAALVFNFKTDQTVVENIKDKDSIKTNVAPTVEKKIAETKKVSVEESEKPNRATINQPEKDEVRNGVPLKIAATKAAPAKNNAVKAAPTDARKNPKPNAAPKSNVPRLVEVEDEDDDSIRLADLFDEIGTE